MGILDFIRSAQVASAIPVDGVGDKQTVTAMQKFFKISPRDGIIGGQTKDYIKKYAPALTAVTYGKNGSKTVSAMQKWCGAKQDGGWGKETSTKLQQKLVSLGYLSKGDIDGVCGTKTMKAFQQCLNNNGKKKPQPTPSTVVEKELEACKVQADWMKNAKYEHNSKPTIATTKKEGTCVDYVAVVLQRIGYLKSGQYIWQNGKGYGTGKVYGTNDKMTTTYMNNKTFKALKSQLKSGDIILCDDNKSGKKGCGGHIMILSHFSGDTPYIWDVGSKMICEKTGKVRSYPNTHKILAVVRLKG